MLRAVVVDDEKPALDYLCKLLNDRGDVEVAGAFTRPRQLLTALRELAPDVVFLDVEMPGTSGLALAQALKELDGNLEIVFVTAYSGYALEAFHVNALHYLLKPADAGMIDRTLARLRERKGGSGEAKASAGARIRCLGGFGIYPPGGAEPIRFPTAKAEELFAFFLLNPNEPLSKWTLCESLWPALDPEKAEQNLHTTVYRMKRTLKAHRIEAEVHSRKGSYAFAIRASCDFREFLERAGRLRGGGADREAELEETVRHYGGPLFGDRQYLWCEAEKERLQREYLDLCLRLARAYTGSGKDSRAASLLRSLLDRYPLEEKAHELLLQMLAERKDRTGFLAHYRRLERLLAAELGVRPRPELRELYERMKE